MGEPLHPGVQGNLYYLLRMLRSRIGIIVFPEIRIQISPTRFRVADIAVWRSGHIVDRVPTVPPFLAIEILAPEDRITRMQPKIAEYLAIGVEWIWLIDPIEKSAICYSQRNPASGLSEVLRTGNPAIDIPWLPPSMSTPERFTEFWTWSPPAGIRRTSPRRCEPAPCVPASPTACR